MEQNLPIIAKKFFNSLRLIYTMLRKGVSKHNIFVHLTMLMKRSKLAGKAALHTLLFHYHHHHHRRSHQKPRIPFKFPTPPPPPPPEEYVYEFDFKDSPIFHYPTIFHLNKDNKIDPKLMADALEIFHSARASPVLPGFGPSPVVRQLRISDSPYPFDEDQDSSHVDEAAERFIIKFYRDLELQNQNSPAFFK